MAAEKKMSVPIPFTHAPNVKKIMTIPFFSTPSGLHFIIINFFSLLLREGLICSPSSLLVDMATKTLSVHFFDKNSFCTLVLRFGCPTYVGKYFFRN